MSKIPANMLWKAEGRTSERYIAMPCEGACYEGHKLPPGHVHEIQDAGGAELKKLCFMKLKTAELTYGKENIFVAEGSSVCDYCEGIMRRSLSSMEVADRQKKMRRKTLRERKRSRKK